MCLYSSATLGLRKLHLNNFLLLLPREQSCEQASSESQRANRPLLVLLPACPTFTKALVISLHVLNG